MSDLAILVPVLGRPHRVEPLLRSIYATCSPTTILFIADEDDEEELDALEMLGTQFISVPGGGYAAKINRGVEETDEGLIFLGADDLEFSEGWFESALERMLVDDVEVVGVADLVPRKREHATHFLVDRNYVQRGTIDSRGLLCELYGHCFVDDEFIATAKARGAYAFASDAIVRHLHPMAGNAPDDSTYQKGLSTYHADRKRFRRREVQWL